MSDELRIFGDKLRTAREALDLSLAEVEAATKIRSKFLQGLENGDTDPSLSPMQVNGFLRNYARHLRLNPDEILTEYEQAKVASNKRGLFKRRTTQIPAVTPTTTGTPALTPVVVKTTTQSRPAVIASPLPAEEGVPLWRRLARSLLVIMAALGFLMLAGGGVALVYASLNTTNNTPSAEEINPPLVNDPANLTVLQSPTPTSSPSPTPTQQIGFVLTPPSVPLDGLTMFITANARSWVEVQVDGVVQYRGLLRPGTGVQYQATDSILLITANAGGLDVLLNNQPLGTLGAQGEAFRQTFTLSGILTPTSRPFATLTPSFTPTESLMVLPTGTPTLGVPATVEGGAAAEMGVALVQPTALPTLPPVFDQNGTLVVTQPPTPLAIPPTIGQPTATPTMTLTPAPTATPSPFLPDRMTRTPRP